MIGLCYHKIQSWDQSIISLFRTQPQESLNDRKAIFAVATFMVESVFDHYSCFTPLKKFHSDCSFPLHLNLPIHRQTHLHYTHIVEDSFSNIIDLQYFGI